MAAIAGRSGERGAAPQLDCGRPGRNRRNVTAPWSTLWFFGAVYPGYRGPCASRNRRYDLGTTGPSTLRPHVGVLAYRDVCARHYPRQPDECLHLPATNGEEHLVAEFALRQMPATHS